MTTPYDRSLFVAALRRALPYIRLYRDRVFVLKTGGALCGDVPGLQEVAAQVGLLRELGIRVVWVHGGGPQTTELSGRLGLQTTLVDGRRVTDAETLDVAVMTLNGSVNTAILSACRAASVQAVGLSGLDAGLVVAARRPPVRRKSQDGGPEVVDYGFVGDVERVDVAVLDKLMDAGVVPVISPLCADVAGNVLNVNADTVASVLARALKAEKLIFLTDVAGLLEDKNEPRTLVSYTDIAGIHALENRGCIDTGMKPKIKATVDALEAGVRRVHLVGWRNPGSLLTEVFTNEGAGTLIVRDRKDLRPDEQVGA